MKTTDVSIGSLLGSSQAMVRVRAFARRASRVDAPVLILGETGTGKSLLARAIHYSGRRSSGPLLAVNCAGIPESLFESEFFGHCRGAFTGAREARRGYMELSRGGSLLLDEVGELSVPQQAKLLTALDDGEVRPLGGERSLRVDCRILAATSRDLTSAMHGGGFRRELYHRLAVLTCRIPPLRERNEDVPLLARRLLRELMARHGRRSARFAPDGLIYLEARPWPGNVREMAHLVEAALILSDDGLLDARALEATDAMAHDPQEPFPCDLAPQTPPGPRMLPVHSGSSASRIPSEPTAGARYSFSGSEVEEREVIRSTLARCRGNRSLAARTLGMARNTLRQKLRKYGLEQD